MMEPDDNALIERIYAASQQPQDWPAVLASLCVRLEAKSAVLVVHAPGTPTAQLCQVHGLGDDYKARYLGHHLATDLAITRLLYQGGSHGAVMSTHLAFPDQAARQAMLGQDYDAFLQRQNIGHIAGSLLVDEPDVSAMIGVHRGVDAPPLAPDQLALLECLGPHLRQALLMHYRYRQELLMAAEGLLRLVEQLPMALLLLDEQQRCVAVNGAAQRLLDSQAVLGLDGEGRLRIGAEAQSQREGGSLMRALRPTLAPRHGSRSYLFQSGHQAYWQVSVVPLVVREGCPVTSAVLVASNEAAALPDIGFLCRAFALTVREGEIALHLLSGAPVEGTAAVAGISLNTVKTHARAIYRKTNTRNQAEFIRVALGLAVAAVDESLCA